MSDSPEQHDAGPPLPPEAAALLHAARTPAQADAMRAARVRTRLSSTLTGGSKVRWWRVRPTAVVLGATLFAAAAAAMYLRPWRNEHAAPPTQRQQQQHGPLATYVAKTQVSDVEELERAPVPEAPALASTRDEPRTRAQPRARPARRRGPDVPAVKAAVVDRDTGAPSSAESELMLEAVRSVRRDGDAARGRALATRYLQLHPNGALREEAQALQIEAALLAHDADARTLAQDYLTRHPNGRFVAVARRALTAGRD